MGVWRLCGTFRVILFILPHKFIVEKVRIRNDNEHDQKNFVNIPVRNTKNICSKGHSDRLNQERSRSNEIEFSKTP